MSDLLIAALIAIACTATGYVAGQNAANTNWQAKQAQYERQAQEQLLAAQARGNTLSSDLLEREAQITQIRNQNRKPLDESTTGRACLNGATLRLLGQSSPGLVIHDLPLAPGSTLATGTPAASAGHANPAPNITSTDTDLANWVADASAQYSLCASRLDALIDWHTGTTPATGHRPP